MGYIHISICWLQSGVVQTTIAYGTLVIQIIPQLSRHVCSSRYHIEYSLDQYSLVYSGIDDPHVYIPIYTGGVGPLVPLAYFSPYTPGWYRSTSFFPDGVVKLPGRDVKRWSREVADSVRRTLGACTQGPKIVSLGPPIHISIALFEDTYSIKECKII